MGVQKTIISEGNGPNPQIGQTIKMHYTGWLKDPSAPNGRGKKFDSSVDRNEVFVVPIGVEKLIKGWDQGVPQMKVGEKAILDITSDFAYGSQTVGGGLIPANSDLIFEVELLGIQ